MNCRDLVAGAFDAQITKYGMQSGFVFAANMFALRLEEMLEDPTPETVERVVTRLQSEINEIELKGQPEDLQEAV